MVRRWHAWRWGGAGVAIWACGFACERIQEKAGDELVEKAIEQHTGKQVTLDRQKRSILLESEDGTESLRMESGGGSAPPDWPGEVPVYPGAKISMSMRMGRGFTLILDTPDSADQVAGFYKSKLTGMQPRASMDLGGRQTLMWVDPGKPMQVTLSIAAGEHEQTNVSLVVTREAETKAAGAAAPAGSAAAK